MRDERRGKTRYKRRARRETRETIAVANQETRRNKRRSESRDTVRQKTRRHKRHGETRAAARQEARRDERLDTGDTSGVCDADECSVGAGRTEIQEGVRIR